MTSVTSPTIAICCPTIDAATWAAALESRLQELHINSRIEIWPNCTHEADYAVTWAPTQAFFDAQQNLKAVFALGAGMDALMRLNIAPKINLVRIEDGGMGAQMADYVTHALLRHVRRFDIGLNTLRKNTAITQLACSA
jgi:glyoxylate/hydroxypyruvate reductase A